jgi:hypothetical protein
MTDHGGGVRQLIVEIDFPETPSLRALFQAPHSRNRPELTAQIQDSDESCPGAAPERVRLTCRELLSVSQLSATSNLTR